MMLSSSPGCRNITTRGAQRCDQYILDYMDMMEVNQVDGPAQRGRIPAEEVHNAWEGVLTGEGGIGWLNQGLDAHRQLDDPLYEGVAELPMYGGLLIPSGGDRFDLPESLSTPPITNVIMHALHSLSRFSRKGTNESEKMKTVIKRMIPTWASSLSQLNEHIRRTGEVGTRMTTEMIYQMEDFDLAYDANRAQDLEPIVFPIKLTSVALLFRQMPRRYIPSIYIPRQPVYESHLSPEIQRFYRILITTIDESLLDGRDEFSRSISQVLPIAMEGWSGSDCANSIITPSLTRFRHMFTVARVREAMGRCDDFVSVIFPEVVDVMRNNPEYFVIYQQRIGGIETARNGY